MPLGALVWQSPVVGCRAVTAAVGGSTPPPDVRGRVSPTWLPESPMARDASLSSWSAGSIPVGSTAGWRSAKGRPPARWPSRRSVPSACPAQGQTPRSVGFPATTFCDRRAGAFLRQDFAGSTPAGDAFFPEHTRTKRHEGVRDTGFRPGGFPVATYHCLAGLLRVERRFFVVGSVRGQACPRSSVRIEHRVSNPGVARSNRATDVGCARRSTGRSPR